MQHFLLCSLLLNVVHHLLCCRDHVCGGPGRPLSVTLKSVCAVHFNCYKIFNNKKITKLCSQVQFSSAAATAPNRFELVLIARPSLPFTFTLWTRSLITRRLWPARRAGNFSFAAAIISLRYKNSPRAIIENALLISITLAFHSHPSLFPSPKFLIFYSYINSCTYLFFCRFYFTF